MSVDSRSKRNEQHKRARQRDLYTPAAVCDQVRWLSPHAREAMGIVPDPPPEGDEVGHERVVSLKELRRRMKAANAASKASATAAVTDPAGGASGKRKGASDAGIAEALKDDDDDDDADERKAEMEEDPDKDADEVRRAGLRSGGARLAEEEFVVSRQWLNERLVKTAWWKREGDMWLRSNRSKKKKDVKRALPLTKEGLAVMRYGVETFLKDLLESIVAASKLRTDLKRYEVPHVITSEPRVAIKAIAKTAEEDHKAAEAVASEQRIKEANMKRARRNARPLKNPEAEQAATSKRLQDRVRSDMLMATNRAIQMHAGATSSLFTASTTADAPPVAVPLAQPEGAPPVAAGGSAPTDKKSDDGPAAAVASSSDDQRRFVKARDRKRRLGLARSKRHLTVRDLVHVLHERRRFVKSERLYKILARLGGKMENVDKEDDEEDDEEDEDEEEDEDDDDMLID